MGELMSDKNHATDTVYYEVWLFSLYTPLDVGKRLHARRRAEKGCSASIRQYSAGALSQLPGHTNCFYQI